MPSGLTRKQQKAQAFKSKQKAKRSGRGDIEQPDVPEADLEDEQEQAVAEGSTSKKRKREGAGEEPSTDAGKGKGKAADVKEEEQIEKPVKKSKKEAKQRFILFVGNMSYKTTVSEIQAHFKPALERMPSIRLLSTKATKDKPSQSRGIAFLELLSSEELQACLKMHHSTLGGRRINVELTAGGGGNSTDRKKKLESVNERVVGQRERRAEREKEQARENGEVGGAGEGEAGMLEGELKPWGEEEPPRPPKTHIVKPEDEGEVVQGAEGQVRIRGGRRVKVKAKSSKDHERKAVVPPQPRQQAENTALSGWQRRAEGQRPAGQTGSSARGGAMVRPKGRRPFALTGANAF